MNTEIIAGYRRLVLAVTLQPGDDDFLPLRECDIEKVQDAINSLDEEFPGCSYGEILKLRFNLDGGGIRTLRKIGEQYNVSAERIRQKEIKALRQLRHPQRGRKLYRLFRSFLERDLENAEKEIQQLEDKLIEIRKSIIGEVTISQLELSIRLFNCLKRAGIKTLADIIKRTEVDFLHMKNLGRRSLYELKEILSVHGLSLARAK